MKLKKISKMSFGERGKEIIRLRKAITRWSKLHDNQKCHEEDDRLAQVVGLKKAGRCRKTATQMAKGCKNYINRECRGGRMIDDRLTKIKSK